MKRTTRTRIKLTKESLRNLSREQAGGVAGGISVGTCTACNETYCRCSTNCSGPTCAATVC